jgi:hypothetical protein
MRVMAEEARAIAEEMTDPESKRSMLEIAAGCELLANGSDPASGSNQSGHLPLAVSTACASV